MLVPILEGDPDYADMAAHIVSQTAGLEPRVVVSLEQLSQLIRREQPAAMVADRALLQGARGVEAVRSMSTAPLVVLTADPQETVSLMEAGADYVLAKPYPPAMLRATMRAIWRRRQVERRSSGRVLEIGPLVVEPARRSARIEGRRHFLSPREADLLEYLALNSGVVLSRRQIIDGAWGGDPTATPAAVTMCIHRLRLKLEADPSHPRLLRTKRSDGYVLNAPLLATVESA
ncbi:MAG TPA: response regulator transcription factor [Candidatus Dormibacteraeota bacterium]|nr:response regulator transcription factor [Candidatus Dormibacteraeota bacterium]